MIQQILIDLKFENDYFWFFCGGYLIIKPDIIFAPSYVATFLEQIQPYHFQIV